MSNALKQPETTPADVPPPLPFPLGPHPATWDDPRALFATPDGRWLVMYCRRHQCGAVFNVEGQVWAIWTPLTLDQFVYSLVERKMFDTATDVFNAWVASLVALIPPPAGPAH